MKGKCPQIMIRVRFGGKIVCSLPLKSSIEMWSIDQWNKHGRNWFIEWLYFLVERLVKMEDQGLGELAGFQWVAWSELTAAACELGKPYEARLNAIHATALTHGWGLGRRLSFGLAANLTPKLLWAAGCLSKYRRLAMQWWRIFESNSKCHENFNVARLRAWCYGIWTNFEHVLKASASSNLDRKVTI